MSSKTPITDKQRSDSGMALVLILLLIAWFAGDIRFAVWAIPVLIITMTFPLLLHPFATAWFAFSNILGRFVSVLALALVYAGMVLPVGLLRRMAGKDRLQLTQFNKKDTTVFYSRDHIFMKEDLERPF